MERSTTTRSERVLTSRLPPRTEDRSVPVVVSLMRSDNVLFARRSVLMCHHVLAVTNCLLSTLYGGPAAAVR